MSAALGDRTFAAAAAPGTSLVGARPELLVALTALRAVVAQEHPGLVFRVADFGGLRSPADTTLVMGYRDDDWNAAVKKDPTLARRTNKLAWRAIKPYGTSMHNFGAAFDVFITTAPPGMSKLEALNIVKDYADVVGLIDGRNFKNPGPDPPHFELPGGLTAAKLAWEKQTGTKSFSA